MFAPDQDAAARELLRVCRPGGRIGLTAWTPASVMAATQALAAKALSAQDGPAPPGPPEFRPAARSSGAPSSASANCSAPRSPC